MLEKKQEEYVEKYRHLQYIEVSAFWCMWSSSSSLCVLDLVKAGVGGGRI